MCVQVPRGRWEAGGKQRGKGGGGSRSAVAGVGRCAAVCMNARVRRHEVKYLNAQTPEVLNRRELRRRVPKGTENVSRFLRNQTCVLQRKKRKRGSVSGVRYVCVVCACACVRVCVRRVHA